eukprot:71653_1
MKPRALKTCSLINDYDAIFYGRQEERRPMGELTASALISLAGTVPVFLVRMLFQWSKPTVIKSARVLPPLTKNIEASSPKVSKDVQMLYPIQLKKRNQSQNKR